MITSNVLQRVLQISGPVGGTGTGFILDWDGRQYMVTASHVLGAVSGAFELRIGTTRSGKALLQQLWDTLPLNQT